MSLPTTTWSKNIQDKQLDKDNFLISSLNQFALQMYLNFIFPWVTHFDKHPNI